MKNLESLLQTEFGHSQFRGEQKAILECVFSGQNALALMPTGMGKSLCYQLPAKLATDGLVLVISPLIALMQDQVEKALGHQIRASFINSSLSGEERARRQQQLSQGEFQLLFVTPERFRKNEFWKAIENLKIDLLAVDEAHCISQWGHDFRPDYSRLGEIRQRLGGPITLALTATATPQVQKDILSQLQIESAPTFSSGIARDNLILNVHDVYGIDEKIRGMVGLRIQYPGPAIYYFSLIQTLYKVSEALDRFNLPHLIYHGQLPAHIRRQNQENFLAEKAPLILATPAFGLGIDKADVRLLVHGEVPNSLESYYQEVGRAGRDGVDSQCHLFYDQEDVSIQMDFIKWANPDVGFVKTLYHLIESGGPGLANDGVDFLRAQMNFYNKRDFRVEAAINLLERWDCLAPDNSRLGFRAIQAPTAEDLKALEDKNRNTLQNQKLFEVVSWATRENGCRKKEIYEYFGFAGEPCGQCDLCLCRGFGDSK